MNQFQTCALGVLLGVLTGCTDIHYYMQSVRGHLDIVSRSQDIEQLAAATDPDTELHNKLFLTLQARQFAASALALSFNNSYSQYVKLDRDYVVKNLYVAEEFSTQLHSWCYPIIGCANYRGYFDEAMLESDRERFSKQGYDIHIAGVTAYSTLGWFDDPVLSTFLELPDYRLVGLLFHELAHQQIYIDGDTFFNESFATAVEQCGLEAFYAATDDNNQMELYRDSQQRIQTMLTMAVQARGDLDEIYKKAISNVNKRRQKTRVLERLTQQYASLVDRRSDGTTQKDGSEETFNNARLGALAAYNKYVPAFLFLFEHHTGDFPPFYAHVEKLGALHRENREYCLQLWSDPKARPEQFPVMCQA